MLFIDETGTLVLWDLNKGLQEKGRKIYIAELNHQPLRMLIRMGVVDGLGRKRMFKKRETAIKNVLFEVSDGEDKCIYETLENV